MLRIDTAQLKLIERLCNAMAVSGDEGEVRRIVLEEVKPYADELKVDALGNVLVRKKVQERILTRFAGCTHGRSGLHDRTQ